MNLEEYKEYLQELAKPGYEEVVLQKEKKQATRKRLLIRKQFSKRKTS